ncbi:hypothetical protein, partial [Klebsiella oxytoca]|uniref:hypothetical protein n=1 Tax=Klebsiella oxytoca TaxID=571 RepID=UPI001CCB7626
FDKSGGKKKGEIGAKIVLFTNLAEVWRSSNFSAPLDAAVFYTLFDPDRSDKTQLQVKVSPDTTASGITDSRYLCKQIGQLSAQSRDCAFNVVFSYYNTERKARW